MEIDVVSKDGDRGLDDPIKTMIFILSFCFSDDTLKLARRKRSKL